MNPYQFYLKTVLVGENLGNTWKASHVIPTYKKSDKRYINNYRPVSLLPVWGKIFKRIVYNLIFLYLENNNLITPNQSCFRPNDSCVNQLLSTVHRIYSDFDENPSLEERSNLLDISKRLMKYGTKAFFLNLKLLVFQVTYSNFFNVFSVTGNKE